MADDTELSGQELFDEAIAPTPKEAPEPVKATEEEGTKGERPRDTRGRFTGTATGEAVVETAPEPIEEPKPEPERPDHIPSWRLKEEAEARRDAERRAQQLESMIAQYEQRIKETQPAPQQPQMPDFFAEPEALPKYFESMLQQREAKWQQDFKAAVANMSLQRAHDRHGEKFQEAFNEITKLPLEHPLRQQVLHSPDPGETLVKVWNQQKTVSAIGDEGVDAYVQKRLEAALEDPEFLAKALEKARGVASAQPTQQIRTPPSLNKATGSRMTVDDDEVSGEALYRYAKG